eukprot:gnl/MRDRNA2_/MRDRNA2_101413_c0_seq1.p1 gnl/MRDRNA2_/MRDRNA2_101413_c0~~gnl/MRDRNA2_/MRDRNA2_101413_c0_seq1.p1  ORF type:complete len:428 (-),score=73.45 gnl/MRDRNA2_/MRDRNA2_101413_c0_seq1:65-1348(-)
MSSSGKRRWQPKTVPSHAKQAHGAFTSDISQTPEEPLSAAQKTRAGRRRNYDPANYPPSVPKTQEFIFDTPKWQAPSVPNGFKISNGLRLDSYLTDGTFGRCFSVSAAPECDEYRKAKGGLVAKIMRPIAKQNQYFGDAEIEAKYLSTLMSQEQCPASIVTFFGSVVFPDPLNAQKQFHALIFEACAASLHAFWQDHARKQSWHPDDIRSVALQLLKCCAFLHGLGFVHTDLKHKNIMLKTADLHADSVRPVDATIKVIDFGNMTHAEDYHTQPIGTRQFRAPEIQLGLDWNEKFDLWGCGCVLHWMHEARTVFEPYSEAEQLDLMERLTGRPLPAQLIARTKKQHLFESGELKRRGGNDAGKAAGGKKGGGKKGAGKRNAVVPISEGIKDLGLQGVLLDLFELDPLDRLPAEVLLKKHESYFRGSS